RGPSPRFGPPDLGNSNHKALRHMDTATGLSVVLVCALAALGYGFWAIQSVLSAPAGNARMQEIAAAIQEGASAYLKRQYTTVSIVAAAVAVVIFIAFGFSLIQPVGFLIG